MGGREERGLSLVLVTRNTNVTSSSCLHKLSQPLHAKNNNVTVLPNTKCNFQNDGHP